MAKGNSVLLIGLGLAALIGIAWAISKYSNSSPSPDGAGASGGEGGGMGAMGSGTPEAYSGNSGAPNAANIPALANNPGVANPYTPPALTAPQAAPQISSSLENALANATYTIAATLNKSIGADIYQPTAQSINITPGLPSSSLPAAQKILDTAVISSGVAGSGNAYSQVGGGVGFGVVQNVATLAAMNAAPVSTPTLAGSNFAILGAGGTYNPNTGTITAKSGTTTSAKTGAVVAPAATVTPKISLTTGAAAYTPAPPKKK